MTTILAIPGSWRAGSVNTALARAAVQCAPPGCSVELASLKDIPLYDGDVETQGIPAAVSALKDRVAAADAILLVSPEYNNSIPGVMKNAVDWMSRPSKDIARVFGDRVFGLIGATPGPGGTRLAQAAWLPVLRTLGVRPYFGKSLFVSDAGKAFGPDGALVDEKIRTVLGGYLGGLAQFAAQAARERGNAPNRLA